MQPYSIEKIQEIIGASLLQIVKKNSVITDLAIDSRNIKISNNTLFFAIVGTRNNGHTYIEELYNLGIRNFVISDTTFNTQPYKDATFLMVNNVLKALQLLAKYHRSLFNFPVIAITGSNGKTIVKEWLYQLLRNDFNIVRSPKSYNSQVGVPLSIWQINEDNNLGIFEAGISLPNEMKKLENIIQPTIGIITNVGEAHAENFVNQEQKIKEKIKLFEQVDTLIYCKDYDEMHQLIKKSDVASKALLFTWSRKKNADLLITKTIKNGNSTEIQAIYNNQFIDITIPFTDEASIENSITCWVTLLFLKYNQADIKNSMLLLSPVAMRLELKGGINNCSVINDSYNSDLGSLGIALDFLNQQKQHSKKTLILSDILQSGKTEEKLYQEVAFMIANKGINKLIGIGEALSRQQDLFNVTKEFYLTTDDFLKQFVATSFENETILLKGARIFSFELISKALQQKAHETVLQINLNAVVHNLNFYKSLIKSDTKVMAMVKAFSYGSGSYEIANVMQYNRIDYLAVAYVDEGVELRKAGITLPIMVMNPEEQSFDNLLKYNLEPEIYSFRILNQFYQNVRFKLLQNIPIHIKLDTGMHRLGFEFNEVEKLCSELDTMKNFKVASVFSHLVASGEMSHQQFTEHQINTFTNAANLIEKNIGYPFIKHILNTSGISYYPTAQFDMVRIGIGMHGISEHPEHAKSLIPSAALKTIISQIKKVAAGDTVGYSRNGVAFKETIIATIPIGYADGYARKLGNGVGKMVVNGHLVPTIGNICMDMAMLDITEINANEGDEVTVFGESYTLSQLAQQANTIAYEILANVSSRVKRVYYHE